MRVKDFPKLAKSLVEYNHRARENFFSSSMSTINKFGNENASIIEYYTIAIVGDQVDVNVG